MDFADATLVHLVARESIETILTVDQTDFSAYPITGKRRFRVLPLQPLDRACDIFVLINDC